MDSHGEYWTNVWSGARTRLERLFDGCSKSLHDIIGDDAFIDSYADAKKVLSFALKHADDCEEKACAILSVGEALHALHELSERSSAEAGAAAEQRKH